MPRVLMRVAAAWLAVCGTGDGAQVFVSPDGDDAAPGACGAPFATLARALDSLAGGEGGVVRMRGGCYWLDEPVKLDARHDGIRVEAECADDPPVLSAGRRLDGWTVDSANRWRLKVDASWRFSQLYVNDTRRLRPFRPRRGYYRVAKGVGVPPGVRPTRFYARAGDVSDTLRDLRRIEFCVFQNWVMSRVPLEEYDALTGLVTLAGGVSRPGQCELTDEHWYRLDNVRDALGEVPGEWYLEDGGTLLYEPAAGESPATATVVAPKLDRIVLVDGATDVAFRGITFAHAGWNVPAHGHAACQAESRLAPWAVSVVRGTRVAFEGCVFRHLGAGALEFGRGARACVARDCEFFDLGGGGVHVGTDWDGANKGDNSTDFAATGEADWAWDCQVTNCLVASGGRVQPAAVGVWVSHAPHTRIVGNTIDDFYYSGVSAGWHWALGTNSTWGNTIALNRIGRIGQGVLSDLGGVYMLGEQRGTVIRENFIHDVSRARYGGWGIYFDSGSSHILASGNLAVDCEDGGWFLARLSASNKVSDNVFAFGKTYQICPLDRRAESAASEFTGNVVYWREGPLWPQEPSAKTVVCRGNLLWREGGRPPAAPDGFAVSDPQFANPSGGDFRRPGAAAPAAGTGCRSGRERARCRVRPRCFLRHRPASRRPSRTPISRRSQSAPPGRDGRAIRSRQCGSPAFPENAPPPGSGRSA